MKPWIALGAVAVAALAGCTDSDSVGTDVAAQAAEPSPSPGGSPDTALLITSQLPAGDAVDASAVLNDAEGNRIGSVTFDEADGRVWVTVDLVSNDVLEPGFHGFHIHANDLPDAGTGCVADAGEASTTWFLSADGHYATEGQSHSAHAGDLPSVQVQDDGTAHLEFSTTRFDLSEVTGKAMILHAGPDNFGNVPVGTAVEQYTANAEDATTKTAKTGNSGDRVVCGLVSEN